TTLEERARLRADLGLDQPFYVQFARYVNNAVHGEFGLSLRQGRKVSVRLKERLPATVELATCAALLALLVGIPLGVYTALRRNSFTSHFVLAASLLGVSLPSFLIGILLILVFAVQLGWLPSFGRGDTVSFGWWTTGFVNKVRLKGVGVAARLAAQERPECAGAADDHALAYPDDAHHASRSLRDARGAAHRLHQVR